jgi:hypothetical protein
MLSPVSETENPGLCLLWSLGFETSTTTDNAYSGMDAHRAIADSQIE